jgi:hypothetical protein
MPRPLRFGGLKGAFSALGKDLETRGNDAGMHFVAWSVLAAADSSVPSMAAVPKKAGVPLFFSQSPCDECATASQQLTSFAAFSMHGDIDR